MLLGRRNRKVFSQLSISLEKNRIEDFKVQTNASKEKNENMYYFLTLTLLGLGLTKINTVSANFNNPKPTLILTN